MAARAYWKGYLRLSLVSIAVEVMNAEDKHGDVHFHQIHRPSGKRIHYVKTAEGVGEVDPDDIASGYEIDKDIYIVMDPEEIDAVKLESKKTIELVQFVDVDEVDPRFFEQPYYVVPTDKYATEGYLVIREALKKTNRMGIGQLTAGGREHLIGVLPLGNGLMLNRLRYEDEVKPEASFFKEIPKMRLDHEMVDLATELIEKKSGPFEPGDFEDHYETELKKLIEQKAKGKKIVAEPEREPERTNVVNLMEALRNSLGTRGSTPRKAAASKSRTASKRPAKRARGR
jgi:DNA end-binding protein Ku